MGNIYTWDGAQYICTLLVLATEQLHSGIQVPLLKGTSTPVVEKHLPYILVTYRFPNRFG